MTIFVIFKMRQQFILNLFSIFSILLFWGCEQPTSEFNPSLDNENFLQQASAETCPDEACAICGEPPGMAFTSSSGANSSAGDGENITGSDADNDWLRDCIPFSKLRTQFEYWGVQCPLSGTDFDAILAACTPPAKTGTQERLTCLLKQIESKRGLYEGVCRHWSVCFQQLAIAGIPADVTLKGGNCDSDSGLLKDKHAWVEFTDPESGDVIVADPQNGMSHFK
jgi:hypothetical protein